MEEHEDESTYRAAQGRSVVPENIRWRTVVTKVALDIRVCWAGAVIVICFTRDILIVTCSQQSGFNMHVQANCRYNVYGILRLQHMEFCCEDELTSLHMNQQSHSKSFWKIITHNYSPEQLGVESIFWSQRLGISLSSSDPNLHTHMRVHCHLGWRTLGLKCNKNNYDWLTACSQSYITSSISYANLMGINLAMTHLWILDSRIISNVCTSMKLVKE